MRALRIAASEAIKEMPSMSTGERMDVAGRPRRGEAGPRRAADSNEQSRGSLGGYADPFVLLDPEVLRASACEAARGARKPQRAALGTAAGPRARLKSPDVASRGFSPLNSAPSNTRDTVEATQKGSGASNGTSYSPMSVLRSSSNTERVVKLILAFYVLVLVFFLLDAVRTAAVWTVTPVRCVWNMLARVLGAMTWLVEATWARWGLSVRVGWRSSE